MRSVLALSLLVWLAPALASDVTFCVVTARRPVSYFLDLVSALQHQGADLMVVDVDNSTGGLIEDVLTPPRVTQECIAGYVGCAVQQQALDVLNALETCAGPSWSNWVVLVEDDMLPCPCSVQAITDVLLDSNPLGMRWGRFAKFSRVIAFPIRSIAPYKAFVMEQLASIPYDQALVYGWGSGPTYQHGSSLFSHRGSVSTIGERNDPAFIREYGDFRSESCGDPLSV